MLENVLTKQNATTRKKLILNAVLSVGLIALAVVLPQIVHLALGQPGGVQLLPMYLPVLIGGCLLGWKWSLAVGVLSPVVSFAITSLMGDPMPALPRLPFMMAELAVFALVSGLFSKRIYENGLWAFPAVILAQLAGRAVFLGLVAIFQSVAPFSVEMIWGQICAGWPGLLIQAIVVPLLIIAIRAILVKKDD
ncbi:ECF transporter S component [Ruminococcus sp.]|uniref:ECF transporter S component n=1 Tax=Ruminococcus sp. TaxID=41978 RepID=UPI002E81AD5C|nr:ECF transporter S component [Ruminococcus sp.]MEE3491583.1 ECF transporter S component [Ruminococcus sp.]